MTARELIQFIVYPKMFRSIDLYCKGRYHLSFAIFHQDQKEVKQYAHPTLVDCNITNSPTKKNKASVNLEDNTFETQNFYVTFNDENFNLNSICTFTLQYDRNKLYQTFLQISLYFTHTIVMRRNKEQISEENAPKDRIHFCQAKRLCVNNLSSFLQFSSVKFTDVSYCSLVHFIFGCFNLGYKIRKNQYQLSQFVKLKSQTIPVEKPTKYKDKDKIGKKIKKIFNFQSIQSFYVCIIVKILKIYQDSINIYQQLLENMEHQVSSKNNLSKTVFKDLSGVLIAKQLRNVGYLCTYYQVQTQNQLYSSLYQESQLISKNVKFVFQKIVEILTLISQNKTDIKGIGKQLLKQLVMFENKMAIRTGSIQNFKSLRNAKINKLNLFDIKIHHHPMIRILNYQHIILPKQSQAYSLVVLVHGYQGNSSDMERVRNIAKLYCENTYFLMISSIQTVMDDKIDDLGKRIAIEVNTTIQNSFLEFKRINFIGFSLGGVLCRAVLKYLQKYKEKINMMITLGSPHLGVSRQKNFFVNVGLWYRIKFQQANNLQELSIPDNGSAQQSMMTKLSKYQSLRWLKKLVVASCREDNMVPYYSARICEQQYDQQIRKISQNIRNRVNKIQRIDVWFDTKKMESILDKMIGRKAHIEFLQNQYFLENLMRIYAKQF